MLDAPAVLPRYARLTDDMLELAHEPRRVEIVDEAGAPLRTGDHERRFFEGAWVRTPRRSLSELVDTHRIVYATACWVYRGVVSHPVKATTTRSSRFFFYHDTGALGRTSATRRWRRSATAPTAASSRSSTTASGGGAYAPGSSYRVATALRGRG